MRILFLCSCLEPARDGVGDYTWTLAAECARRGHSCAIIALHDRFIAEPTESVVAGPEKIPFLRLPSKLTWRRRTEQASAFRSHFQPDWISLQLVPYGFNDKGLVWSLGRALRTLTTGHRLHLMLHELWIGQSTAAPFRQRFIGLFQRLGLTRLISLLQPQLVTTSNPSYVAALKAAGIHAVLLPLFGNIPVAPVKTRPELPDELMRDRDQWWLGIFFGALHPEWKPEPFLGILKRAAHQAKKRICLLLAGRPGAVGDALWQNLGRTYGSDLLFIKWGEQPAEKISVLLQSADFGIAASPWQLVGKSGTIAAMLDHGLPVIVTRDDYQTRDVFNDSPSTDPLLHRCDDSLEAKLSAGLPKRAAHSRLDEITTQFHRLLDAAVVS